MTKQELSALGWQLISPDFICNREWTITRKHNLYNDDKVYLLAKGAMRNGQYDTVELAIKAWEELK